MTAPTAIVQRYVKSVRHAQQARATQELVWEPGSAQVDFGEADFNVNGLCRRMKYLTVSFLYSNDGFTQVFGGETAECVCQGLRNIFEYIGGVPPLFSREDAKSWRAAQFIREHKNFILYGPVGTGKTHLAIAIGVKAC